jgi:hypothetical protein
MRPMRPQGGRIIELLAVDLDHTRPVYPTPRVRRAFVLNDIFIVVSRRMDYVALDGQIASANKSSETKTGWVQLQWFMNEHYFHIRGHAGGYQQLCRSAHY